MSGFRDEARFRIMRLLDARPDLSQREIASELGISLGAVNYCLKALVAKGYVKVRNFRVSDRKWRYVYVLTPSGALAKGRLTSRFLRRKLAEYDALKAEIEALQAELRHDGDGSTDDAAPAGGTGIEPPTGRVE